MAREPGLVLGGVGDVDALDLEDDGARAVVAARDDHALVRALGDCALKDVRFFALIGHAYPSRESE